MRLKNQLFKIRKVGGQKSDIKDVNCYLLEGRAGFFSGFCPSPALYSDLHVYRVVSVFNILREVLHINFAI